MDKAIRFIPSEAFPDTLSRFKKAFGDVSGWFCKNDADGQACMEPFEQGAAREQRRVASIRRDGETYAEAAMRWSTENDISGGDPELLIVDAPQS